MQRYYRHLGRVWRWVFVGVLVAGLIGGLGAIAPASPPVHRVSASQSIGDSLTQGRSLYQSGRFAEAIAFWQRVEQTAIAQNDPLMQAQALNYLALAHQQLGEWDAADRAIATSLDRLQSADGSLDQVLPLRAQALNGQGYGQFQRGQTEAALATWQQAEQLYTAAHLESGRIGSVINQAQALQTLGFFLQARQRLTELERSLQSQPDPALSITGWRSLGETFRLMGDLASSERVLQQGWAIAQSTNPPDLSPLLLSLGNTAQAQADLDSALSWYQQAADAAQAPPDQIRALLNQVGVLLALGRADEGRSLLPTIQITLDQQPPGRTVLEARLALSQYWHRLGDADSRQTAAEQLAIVVQQAEALGDRRMNAYAHGYLGQLYEQTQQWAIADQLTRQAVQLAQTVQAADMLYRWQWQLGRIWAAQGQVDQARTAYQTAFDTLQTIRRELLATPADLQFSFRDSIEPVYREFVELLLRDVNSDEADGQTRLLKARQVIEALQVAELDNFFRTACLDGQQVAIDQINQQDAAVIYPIVLRDRLDIILSLPQQPLRHYRTAIDRTTLETTLTALRLNLERPFTSPEGRTLATAVYDWLIRPLEDALQQTQIQTLVFVLDAGLRNVPMAALYDGQRYLIETYGVAIAPGLQLLNPQALAQTRLEVLAAGLTEARYGFSSLQQVQRELNEIQTELPSRVLLNEAFTSDALQAQIDRTSFPIVHLATHGQFSSDLANTFILAWDKPITITELSTVLRSSDAVRDRPIELLVLSACETAAGDTRATLGLAGLAVQAGVRSTLASLWSVDDESSAVFVSQFYQTLSQTQRSKANALRQAQLSLLHNPNYRHPRYWAPYVLVGNWL